MARPKSTPPERIPDFATKIRCEPNGCWIWTGGTSGHGYGSFYDGEKQTYAHRFSYRMFIGEIPDGFEIDHLCKQRLCVNQVI